MLKAAAGEPDAQILLLGTDQPLLNHAAIKSLMAQTGAWRLSPSGPVSLNLAELKTAVEQLRQRNPEADSDCLLSHLEETVRPRALECDPQCLLRVKTRRDLVQAQAIAKKHIVEGWLDSGVAFSDPDSAHIGPRVRMAPKGVVIEPNVRLEGEIVVGEGTTIGQGVIVRDAKLGAGVEVRPYCVIDSSIVGDGAKIGPFAHLRLGTLLDSDVHLGNFVETKKAHMRAGAKANHLSYLGDCEVGEKTNVGAGCITCNYDGFNKHRTVIGKNVFVGSDCQLVAPVTVGDGALLAAGTTLTKDVPKDALVLTRPETTIKEGSAERLRAKLRRQKEQGTGNRG
jgi:bifunctional UDP-N-acetylglucosamine pyrophosphorylase/glucosamine-1-phosphate N-acetyltransferase